MKSIFSKIKEEKGQNTVEFALIASLVLLPVLFGITEFGRAWYHADLLKGAANIAARTYAVQGAAAGQTKATSLIADALANNNMTITIIFTTDPASVTATVRETFRLLVPLPALMGLNNILITRTATYRLE